MDLTKLPVFETLRDRLSYLTARQTVLAENIANANTPGFSSGFQAKDMPDSESTPNGNSVVLEEQMMKLSSNQMDYSAATSLYSKAMGLIRLAAGIQK